MGKSVIDITAANIADMTVTATTPGTGADASTWTGAQCTAAYNDIVALTAKVNSLITALENIGVLAKV
jgi:hypothetical protein